MDNETSQQNIPTRLNNPGDLKEVGQTNSIPDSSGFASFPTPHEGYATLLNDLQSKINKKPDETLADFSNTYAPNSDGNDTHQYTVDLANQLKVPPNSTLSSLQPKIGEFADAVAHNEGYQPQDVSQETPSQPTDPSAGKGMSTLEKLALGIGGTAAAGAGIAFAPEIAAGVGAAGEAATSIPVVGGLIPKIEGALGITGAVDTVKGLFGNKGSQTNADEQAQASEEAGQTEANATNQTSENNIKEQENVEEDQEAQTQNQLEQEKSATQALNQTLQTTPTGKLLASSPQVQQTLGYMAQNGYLPDTSTGVNDFGVKNNSGAFKKSSDSIKELSSGAENILDLEGGQGDVESTRQKVHTNIRQFVPTHEQGDAIKYADEILASGEKEYGNGGSIPLSKMEKLKRESGQAAGKWDMSTPSAKKAAFKAVNRGLRAEIAEKTTHKDLYNKVMKEEEKIFATQKLMKKMEGKKALEHKGLLRGALKSYGKYVGTYLGDKIGGPLGAIVGTMVGDHLTKAVDKRFGKTYFESKEGKRLIELASQKSPHMAKILKKELKKYGVVAEEAEKKLEEETKKEVKRKDYKEKKKGILNHDTQTKNPYMNLEDFNDKLKTIHFGKTAIPKKKESQKGLLTIKA